MKPFAALVRKVVHESRGTLLLTAAALFGLGWLSVYITSRNESQILKAIASGELGERLEWLRRLGIGKAPSSVELMMAFWNHPFFVTLVAIWGISRGSAAVSAEIERGTMDLLLSRPVSRTAYLLAQVLVAVLGLCVLGAALAAGAILGVHYNTLRVPPGAWELIRVSANLAALALPIYGYTLLISTVDHVRWRPTWIGSTLTLAGFIGHVITAFPVFAESWWKPWVDRVSIFSAYDPVELVTKAESFGPHVGILAGVGGACVVLGFILFARRDLPANG